MVSVASFSYFPRLRFVDVLVQPAHLFPHAIERPVKAASLERRAVRPGIVFKWRHRAHQAALVTLNHRRRPLHGVSQLVSELVVVGLFKLFPRKIAVVVGWNVAQEKVAESIGTIAFDN